MTLLTRVCDALDRLDLYANDETYASACAFVAGADYAMEGALLLGFREWLVTELGHSNNFAWQRLVLEVAYRDGGVSSSTDVLAIKCLQTLLLRFDAIRSEHGGVKRVFVNYQRWLEQQEWFDSAIDGVEHVKRESGAGQGGNT